MDRKLGPVPPFLGGAWFPSNNLACAEAISLPPCQVFLDPCNCLATIHQRRRQNRQTDRQDRQDRHNSLWPGTRPTSILSGILIYPDVWRQRTWASFYGGGAVPPFWGGLGPHLTQCGLGRVYLHAMFHFDPCNRLATIHQRYRQTERHCLLYTSPSPRDS